MNKFRYFIGIDVSKLTLDICVLDQSESIYTDCIANQPKAITKLFNQLKRKGIDCKNSLVCAENTGIYTVHLQRYGHSKTLNLWVENAMQIKKSQGVQRGKSDKVDALRIAEYAFRNQDKFVLWNPLREPVALLKKLSSLRKRLIDNQKRLKQSFTDSDFLSTKEKSYLKKACRSSLSALKKDIKQIEAQMNQIIKEDHQLYRLFKIITSVDGVGSQTAIEILITTNELRNISEAKKYACYSGVVPFNYSSGTSVKTKPRVSKMANNKVKSLLHMCALSAIKMEGEMREYYLRKTKEGKNKMSTINAVRNKLVNRIFACVKQNRVYQKKYQFSLVNP